MKTKAVRIYGKEDLRLEEFELPQMSEGEILVKIVSDSLCMSTCKAAAQGARHYRVPNDVQTRPAIIGHEFCGEIVEVGERWRGEYHVGDKVIIPPVLAYLGGVDTIGYSFGEIGGDSTYSLVREHIIQNGYLLKAAGDAFFGASLVEPASCILRGYKASFHLDGEGNHVTGLKAGGKLAILAGCGPMGLAAIDVALHGAFKPSLMVVTDIDETRLGYAARVFDPGEAKKSGVKLVYTNTTDAKVLTELSNGGFDDVYVYAPVASLVELADKILGFDGCLNFFAGPLDKSFSANLNFYNVHYAQHHVAGTSGSTMGDMKEALRLINENRINPAVMITHVGGLNAVVDATMNLAKTPGGKKLIYTHIDMPLTAIADFAALGEKDGRFKTLAHIVAANNGLWCAQAERYLLENF